MDQPQNGSLRMRAARLPLPGCPVGVIAGVVDGCDNLSELLGPDDGLFSVVSTKMTAMTDFVQVDSSHTKPRHINDVLLQTLAFLRDGRFFPGKK